MDHGTYVRCQLRTCCAQLKFKVKQVFPEKKSDMTIFFDVTECLQQIEMPDLLHICAPCSELPYRPLFCRQTAGPINFGLAPSFDARRKFNLWLQIFVGPCINPSYLLKVGLVALTSFFVKECFRLLSKLSTELKNQHCHPVKEKNFYFETGRDPLKAKS